jgi:hypothetical protein
LIKKRILPAFELPKAICYLASLLANNFNMSGGPLVGSFGYWSFRYQRIKPRRICFI